MSCASNTRKMNFKGLVVPRCPPPLTHKSSVQTDKESTGWASPRYEATCSYIIKFLVMVTRLLQPGTSWSRPAQLAHCRDILGGARSAVWCPLPGRQQHCCQMRIVAAAGIATQPNPTLEQVYQPSTGDRVQCGSIHVIMGPMFAGKTSELLRSVAALEVSLTAWTLLPAL